MAEAERWPELLREYVGELQASLTVRPFQPPVAGELSHELEDAAIFRKVAVKMRGHCMRAAKAQLGGARIAVQDESTAAKVEQRVCVPPEEGEPKRHRGEFNHAKVCLSGVITPALRTTRRRV